MKALVWQLASLALIAGAAANTDADPASSSSTKDATTYPTTITRIWTRTLTSKPPKATATETDTETESTSSSSTAMAATQIGGYVIEDVSSSPSSSSAPSLTTTSAAETTTYTGSMAVQTVTLYEPWPSSPNPEWFPYTLTQTAVTTRHEYTVTLGADGLPSTSALPNQEPSGTVRTATSTWVLWTTSPTDLAVGQALPKCKDGCTVHNMKQDRRCIDRGLVTACHSQCKIRQLEHINAWVCQHRNNGTSKANNTPGGSETREVALGRVCTDTTGYYEQLLEPCDSMDHRHDCPSCDMVRPPRD